MQQGLCESFVWEEFTSHGLHSVKREDPSFLDGSSSTKVRAPIHMEKDLQIEVKFRCICLCKWFGNTDNTQFIRSVKLSDFHPV